MVYSDLLQNPLIVPLKRLQGHNKVGNYGKVSLPRLFPLIRALCCSSDWGDPIKQWLTLVNATTTTLCNKKVCLIVSGTQPNLGSYLLELTVLSSCGYENGWWPKRREERGTKMQSKVTVSQCLCVGNWPNWGGGVGKQPPQQKFCCSESCRS